MIYDITNIFILLGILVLIKDYKNISFNFFYLSFVFILGLIIFTYYDSIEINLLKLDEWKKYLLMFIMILFFLVIKLVREKTFDVYCLIVLVFIGSAVLITCDNFIILYLGLELQTFSLFILIAKNRTSIKSSEAGLKYFILGAASSGLYLLSISILFLFGYDLQLGNITLLSEDYIILICLSLITFSFSFKLGLFPLHFWIPDIYEGSSWDIISLISTLPKISILAVLVQILTHSNLLQCLSLLSIIIGTLGALNQSKLKRLLAYSGISHIGFITLGYSVLMKEGNVVSSIYLVVYMLTMVSLFILITRMVFKNQYLIELSFLNHINKLYSITLILIILSIGGIPPLSGFISKWYIIWTSVSYSYNISAFIMILFSAIGAGYYLRLVKMVYFQKQSSYLLWENVLNHKKKDDEFLLLNLGFLFFVSLFLIINFSFMINIIYYINTFII